MAQHHAPIPCELFTLRCLEPQLRQLLMGEYSDRFGDFSSFWPSRHRESTMQRCFKLRSNLTCVQHLHAPDVLVNTEAMAFHKAHASETSQKLNSKSRLPTLCEAGQ